MTISAVFVVILIICGGWALVLTGRMLNTRQTQPSVLLCVRVLFILSVTLLILTQMGAIQNVITRP
jgi:uncharacterized membrane protein